MISVTYPSAGGQSGSNYNVPEPGDVVTQSLTDFLVQLASQGVAIPTTADLDLGAAFGVKSLYFKTRTANPAASGLLRLAAADAGPTWRNAANTGDVGLAKDSGDALTFNGANVTGNPMLNASTAAGQSITSGAATIVVFGTVNRDSDSAYNSGTGRYTVPTGKGGDYQVTATISWSAAPGNTPIVAIYKNGVEFRRVISGALTPGGICSQVVSSIDNYAAGDIIDIRVTQISGGAVTLYNATATANYMALKRIPT